MELHGWTDAFHIYFHSFYRKKEIKLGNHRIHTKSIYFVDFNQDFLHEISILLRCDSFYRKDEIRLATVLHNPHKSNLLFFQECVEKHNDGKIPQSKKAKYQIMTFHRKCQILMRCDSLCDENDFIVLQWKSFILDFTSVPLYWVLNRICSSISRVHMMCLLIIISHIYKKKEENRIYKRIIRRNKLFFTSQKLSSW